MEVKEVKMWWKYTIHAEIDELNEPNVPIKQSSDVEQYVRSLYKDDINIYESVYILFLNRANKITGYALISQGGRSGALVDKMLVFKYAVESLSCGIILVHNHPSGNLKPSLQDYDLVKSLKQGLKLLGSQLVDSIIISNTGIFSMRDAGTL